MIYHGDAMAYLCETPKILAQIQKHTEEIIPSPVLTKMVSIGELLIVGTGSSYNAGLLVKDYLRAILHKRVDVIYPSELDTELRFGEKEKMVIGISQQGTSVSVIDALDRAACCGHVTIAMTGEEQTEITRHAKYVIPIACGIEDAGATTKGFTVTAYTLLMTAVTGVTKCGHDNKINTVLRNLPEKLEKCLSAYKSRLDHMAEQMAGFTHLLIISSKEYKRLMPEAALKFSETCRKSVSGMEVEAFCHGMYNAVQADTTFLFLAGKGDRKIEKLMDYYKKRGNAVYSLEYAEDISTLVDIFACEEGSTPEDYSIIERIFGAVICLQYLFVKTSRAMGVDLNVPSDPEFHVMMGSKIEDKEDRGLDIKDWK